MTSILIVDDERIIARDIQTTLQGLGYYVPATAGSADEALAFVEQYAPDLVIMDIRLAGDKDGIDAAAAIRQVRSVPIVFLTSYSDERTLARARKAEPYGYLLKPFSDRELQSVIEIALYKHRTDLLLAERERLLTATMRSIDDALIAIRADGTVHFMSHKGEQLLRIAADAAVGVPHGHLLPLLDERTGKPLEDVVAQAIDENRAVRARAVLKRPPPLPHLPVSVCATPVAAENAGPVAAVITLHDASDERRREAQLALSDRMAAVGLLSSGLAHEINNPLTFVLGNLEVLAEQFSPDNPGGPLSPEDIRTVILDAWSGAERIRSIVAKLRRWGGGLARPPAPVDVRSAIGFALKVVENELRHRAKVTTKLDPVPLVVAREEDLTQVFLSILLNAIQAIPEDAGLGTVTVATRTSSLHEAIAEITDTGTGIMPDVLPRIFDPFFTTKPRDVGTGLGLAICHDIVSRLGGRIEVESTIGVGTTVRVVLPAEKSARTHTPSSRKMQAVTPISMGPRPDRARVLVVDDEPAVAASLARILRTEHDVVTSESGADLLARVARGELFDVILCDVMMPGLSGHEVSERLAKMRPELLPRLVLMTGGAFTEKTRAFLEESPHLVLEKPIQSAALKGAVTAVLTRLSSVPAAREN